MSVGGHQASGGPCPDCSALIGCLEKQCMTGQVLGPLRVWEIRLKFWAFGCGPGPGFAVMGIWEMN